MSDQSYPSLGRNWPFASLSTCGGNFGPRDGGDEGVCGCTRSGIAGDGVCGCTPCGVARDGLCGCIGGGVAGDGPLTSWVAIIKPPTQIAPRAKIVPPMALGLTLILVIERTMGEMVDDARRS